ncbi:hypothetical protein N9948_02230, partial [bacterium]|nr:hypothetical protein [bacterium]
FMDKGIKVNGNPMGQNSYSSGVGGNGSDFDDNVTFVPEINVSDLKTQVKAEEVTQEGTEDILAKLKGMK